MHSGVHACVSRAFECAFVFSQRTFEMHERYQLGFLHVKAVDDAGHDKSADLKIEFLEVRSSFTEIQDFGLCGGVNLSYVCDCFIFFSAVTR